MLCVFICEDDSDFLKRLQKCVEGYVSMENLAMPVVCATTNPDDVLTYLRENEPATGLYFLDLNLGTEMNGIQLAEKIRVYDPWGAIVFITTDVDSHKLTFEYKVEAMDYIVKNHPALERRVCECIENAHTKFTSKEAELLDKFIVKINRDASGFMGFFNPSKDSVISLDSRTIQYFETSLEIKNSIVIYTSKGSLQFRGSLSRIQRQLDKKRFYKCQRNIIVNLENVVAVDCNEMTVLFANGMEMDILPAHIHNLKKRVAEARGL